MNQTPLQGAADHKELIEALDRFSTKTDMLLRNNSNTSTVTISAGGVGLWLAAFCSALTFVMFCVTLVLFVNHDRKIDDLGDYLAAIYAQAPHLKPPEEKKE